MTYQTVLQLWKDISSNTIPTVVALIVVVFLFIAAIVVNSYVSNKMNQGVPSTVPLQQPGITFRAGDGGSNGNGGNITITADKGDVHIGP